MKRLLAILLLVFSGTLSAYKAADIPLFPDIADCLEYDLLDRQTVPQYMECSNLEGDKFSVPIYDFDRNVGVGSDADLPQGLQPIAKVVDVPPVTIVFYVDKEHMFSSAVMYEQTGSDFLTGIKPVLILGDLLSPRHLQYYGFTCDNWITVSGEGSFCDGDNRGGVPSDFPYYAFLTHSGGNHCCFDLVVVDKESPHHLLYVYDGVISAPRFKDVDHDGQYEMVVSDYSYRFSPYGPANLPLAPDIIWHMTPFGLYLAPELMLKPLPTAATLANYKRSVNDESDDNDQLLYEVTLDLIYSGHEEKAWEYFDDAWPAFFVSWSRYDQWNSDSNTENQTQKEKEEFYKEQYRSEFVKDVCTSRFARSLSGTDRQHFLGQTCY